MQFLVTGLDGADTEAMNRRLAVREAHLALGVEMKNSGNLLFAAAILSEDDKMIGSTMICQFDSREDLDKWLKIEPYVTGKVWQQIQVQKCKTGPMFTHSQDNQ